jgi:hypothetical protein
VPLCDAAGFEGVLSGTSIEDLIQMSCLALATRALRVAGDDEHGAIFLSGGQIVHAETRASRGEEALFEILAWRQGRFDIQEGRCAPEETITRMWQSLLLEAAYRLDESRRPREGSAEKERTTMEGSPLVGPLDRPEIKAWVRFTTDGERLGGRAADVEELQSSWAYLLELARALGGSLGLEGFASIETRGPEGRSFCRVAGNRLLGLVSAPGVDVMAAANQAGDR